MTSDLGTQDLIRLAREESERTREDEYPESVRPVRPNRKGVYTIRLEQEDIDALESVARKKHFPTSTMVRSWVLERLEQERHS